LEVITKQTQDFSR